MKHTTELVFILDRSGSMSGLETDTIGGFNSMIAKQKKEAGEALRSRIKTNSVVCFIKKPPVICYLYGSKSQESSGRFSSDIFMRRASSDQRRTERR